MRRPGLLANRHNKKGVYLNQNDLPKKCSYTISREVKNLRKKLKIKAKKLCKNGVSPQTLAIYQQKRGDFKKFAQSIKMPHLPASEKLISYYIAHLSGRKLKPSTLKGYLAAISFFHKNRGINIDCSSPHIKQLIKGVNYQDKKCPKKRKPIKFNLLSKIIAIIPKICLQFDSLLFKSVLALQYHACLRIGEVVTSKTSTHTLKKNQIKIKTKSLSIHFKSFKHARQSNKKLKLLRQSEKSNICPVQLLTEYNKVRPRTKGDVQFFITKEGKPINRLDVAKVLKNSIKELGLNSENFNTHSMRIGRATQLHLNQCPGEDIKRYGRWSSDAYLTYIKTNKLTIPQCYD